MTREEIRRAWETFEELKAENLNTACVEMKGCYIRTAASILDECDPDSADDQEASARIRRALKLNGYEEDAIYLESETDEGERYDLLGVEWDADDFLAYCQDEDFLLDDDELHFHYGNRCTSASKAEVERKVAQALDNWDPNCVSVAYGDYHDEVKVRLGIFYFQVDCTVKLDDEGGIDDVDFDRDVYVSCVR